MTDGLRNHRSVQTNPNKTLLTIVAVETRPDKLEIMGDPIDDCAKTTHTVLHNLRNIKKIALWERLSLFSAYFSYVDFMAHKNEEL